MTSQTSNAFAARNRSERISVRMLCVMAMAIAINVIGGQIALFLHLPIYLDSMGTIMTAILYGSICGMLPPLAYGLVMGLTVDIYSLYFMPVGMVLGLVTGLAARRIRLRGAGLIPAALLITIPGTIVSSIICAVLFGGITSSGSTIIVQMLHQAGLGMTASVFVVQILTDFIDRLLSLVLVTLLLRRLGHAGLLSR